MFPTETHETHSIKENIKQKYNVLIGQEIAFVGHVSFEAVTEAWLRIRFGNYVVSVANRFGLFGKTHYPYLEMVKCLHADC
jgi:hypothetical protein